VSDLVEPAEPALAGRRRSVMSTTSGTHLGAFTPLDWLLFWSIGLIWGSSFLLIAIGLDAFEPGLVTWLRIVFGAAALWMVPAARQRTEREDLPRLVVVSVLWVAIPFTLFPLAEQHIASGITGLINGSLPIFAVAFGSIMLRRVPGRSQALGLVLGFLGIVAIALPSFNEGSSEAIGVLLALGAVVCYGVAINLVTPLTQRYGSLPVMARVIGMAAILTLPFGVVSVPASTFEWTPFLAVVVLGVMGTGVAFVLMGRLVARVGTRASFATYLIPVVALILGVVFRDESVHVLSIVGVALVLSGALLASRKERDA
jgi:drug/metabolite transporter (DMT)-like permease